MERKTVRSRRARIEEVRRRFRSWRRTCRRGRIPEDLWNAAAELAGALGVNPVAQELGLDYCSLKRRTEEASSARKAKQSGPTSARFVEVELPARRPRAECVVEVEDRSGTRLTVRLAGAGPDEVTAIAKALWKCQP
jgi:hypothetical protein